MGELFIWQHLKGLSLGSESCKGGGGEGFSLKEPQHLFHAVEEMEGRAKTAPSPRQSPRLRLIPFHAVGNPHYWGVASGRGGEKKKLIAATRSLVCSALVQLQLDKVLRNNNCFTAPFCSTLQWSAFLVWGQTDIAGTHPCLSRVQGKWERNCLFREKKYPFSEVEMKKQTARNIRFGYAHKCPTSRSPVWDLCKAQLLLRPNKGFSTIWCSLWCATYVIFELSRFNFFSTC